jgi:hypothetical protein
MEVPNATTENIAGDALGLVSVQREQLGVAVANLLRYLASPPSLSSREIARFYMIKQSKFSCELRSTVFIERNCNIQEREANKTRLDITYSHAS